MSCVVVYQVITPATEGGMLAGKSELEDSSLHG